jgi:hypothetical protein
MENASVTAVQSEGDDFKILWLTKKEFYKLMTNTASEISYLWAVTRMTGVIRYYERDLERQEEKTLLADAARLIKNAPLIKWDAQKLEEELQKSSRSANTTQHKIPGDPNRKAARRKLYGNIESSASKTSNKSR